jgi:outer membrane lipoprotein-sorting protein
MNRFRRLSPRGLAALIAALAAVGLLAAGLVVSALGGSGAPPLDEAIQAALAAPPPAGITAQVTLSDHLFDASGLGPLAGLAGPLLSGASGELRVGGDGHARLDLQTALGEIEVLFDGTSVTVYDPAATTAWRLPLPAPESGGAPTVPSLAEIDGFLAALGGDGKVSGPTTSTVAGQAAYTVTLSPAAGGGLIGSAALSFDAATGVPLQLAIDARGSTSPVLELTVTSISYAAVPAADVELTLPSGVNVVNLSPPTAGAPAAATAPSGLAAVARAVPFTLVAPDALGGLPRSGVRLIGAGSLAGALVTYGTGPGTLVLGERATTGATGGGGTGLLDLLPGVSIDGTTGHELVTALGTIITVDRGGVSYALAGSLDQADAESAARALLS